MAKKTFMGTSIIWGGKSSRRAGEATESDEDYEMLGQILKDICLAEDEDTGPSPNPEQGHPARPSDGAARTNLGDALIANQERDENGYAVVDAKFISNDDVLVDEYEVLDRVMLANLRDLLLGAEAAANGRRGHYRGEASSGERLVEKWGIENGFTVIRERTFDGCRGRRRREMPFDAAFYTPVGNALMEVILVEYQGEQHYRPIGFFGGKKSFLRQVERDQKKKAFCQRESHLLICVPYTAKTKEEVGEIIAMSLDA